ncbi:hypothetical protein REPUB_Repub01dG0102000 [Reevesia pubescens]
MAPLLMHFASLHLENNVPLVLMETCNGQLMGHFSSLDLLTILASYGMLTKVPSIRCWKVISIVFKVFPGIPRPKQQRIDSKSVKSHLFHEETLSSFSRRLAWSPGGSFLLVPTVLSSQDGYCTSVEFEKDELGVAISLSKPKFMNAENKSPIVQKPDEMVIETTRADDSITGDNTKVECAGRRKCMLRRLNA